MVPKANHSRNEKSFGGATAVADEAAAAWMLQIESLLQTRQDRQIPQQCFAIRVDEKSAPVSVAEEDDEEDAAAPCVDSTQQQVVQRLYERVKSGGLQLAQYASELQSMLDSVSHAVDLERDEHGIRWITEKTIKRHDKHLTDHFERTLNGVVMKCVGEKFNIEKLKPLQAEVLAALQQGRDVVVLAYPGLGKSLFFQIPFMLKEVQATNKVNLMITPFNSLRDDQMLDCDRLGVPYLALKSLWRSEDPRALEHQLQELDAVVNGSKPCKVIFISPEKLEVDLSRQADMSIAKRLRKLYTQSRLGLVVLDEAHEFIMMKNFRASFDALREMLKDIGPRLQTLALSGTSTAQQAKEMCELLGLSVRSPDLRCFRVLPTKQTFKNHEFVVKKASNYHSVNQICSDIMSAKARYQTRGWPCGIIFVATPDDAEQTADKIRVRLKIDPSAGSVVAPYHGKMSQGDRDSTLRAWKSGKSPLVVATMSTFGAGIHNKDCRLIIHQRPAQSIAHYVQQALRAGRDGAGAKCVLYYKPTDEQTLTGIFINNVKTLASPQEKAIKREELAQMMSYCRSTQCRLGILFEELRSTRCKLCDNCKLNDQLAAGNTTFGQDIVRIELSKYKICETLCETLPMSYESGKKSDEFAAHICQIVFKGAPVRKKGKGSENLFPNHFTDDLATALACAKAIQIENGLKSGVIKRGSTEQLPSVSLDINLQLPGGRELYHMIYLFVIRAEECRDLAADNDVYSWLQRRKELQRQQPLRIDGRDAYQAPAQTHGASTDAPSLICDRQSAVRAPGIVSDVSQYKYPPVIKHILEHVQYEFEQANSFLASIIERLEGILVEPEEEEGGQRQEVAMMNAISEVVSQNDLEASRVIPFRGKMCTDDAYWRLHCELNIDENGRPMIKMQVPEPVRYKRAFARFGWWRFCYARIPLRLRRSDREDDLKDLVQQTFLIGGLEYRFWRPHNPYSQDSTILLFAPGPEESGCTLADLHHFIHPPSLRNAGKLKNLAKYNKRDNLALSDCVKVRDVDATQVEIVDDMQAGDTDESTHDDGFGERSHGFHSTVANCLP